MSKKKKGSKKSKKENPATGEAEVQETAEENPVTEGAEVAESPRAAEETVIEEERARLGK